MGRRREKGRLAALFPGAKSWLEAKVKLLRSISTAVLLIASVGASAAPTYRLTIVDPPPGFADPYVQITRINNNGDVAGTVRRVIGDLASDRPLIRTADGVMHVLPLPPRMESFANFEALNDRLQAIAYQSPDLDVGYFWDPASGWAEIVPPPGGSNVQVKGLNQMGDVVGSVGFNDAGRAFSWNASKGFKVRKPGEQGDFVAINSRRQVAGVLAFDTGDHRPPQAGGSTAFRAQLGSETVFVGDLIVMSRKDIRIADRFNYSMSSRARDINEAGTMAVDAIGPDETTEYPWDITGYACLWRRYQGLICPAVPVLANAIAVGGSDQLLFQSQDLLSQLRGTSIWIEGDAAPVFLADLLESGTTEVTAVYATDINESGAIAVNVQLANGSLRGAILTPVGK
jgi:hypothetical protein